MFYCSVCGGWAYLLVSSADLFRIRTSITLWIITSSYFKLIWLKLENSLCDSQKILLVLLFSLSTGFSWHRLFILLNNKCLFLVFSVLIHLKNCLRWLRFYLDSPVDLIIFSKGVCCFSLLFDCLLFKVIICTINNSVRWTKVIHIYDL